MGVVLAGGRSSRFGSDKAEALLAGRPLLDHALDILRRSCDAVAVVGRVDARAFSLPDWPAPGFGPLAGLAGALRHAAAEEFHQVLSVPVDAPLLTENLRAALEPAPACLAGQPVIGLWQAEAMSDAESLLLGDGKHSLHAFARRIGARLVDSIDATANINTTKDLADLNAHFARDL